MEKKRDFFIAVSISIAAAYAIYLFTDSRSWLRKLISRRSRPWVQIGHVSQLFIHPIKSCKAIEIAEAQCTKVGLKNGSYQDRHFVFMDTKNNNFLTGRPRKQDNPKLVLVEAKIERELLTLSAPGMTETVSMNLKEVVLNGLIQRVKLWREAEIDGYDCGDGIAKWITDFLGGNTPGQYRLLYYRPNLFNGRMIKNDAKYGMLVDQSRCDKAVYADLAPFLLTTNSTLEDLNLRLEKKVSQRNFRPNIVVEGPEACDEHKWMEVKIGSSAEFINFKPCTRCMLVTVDPDSGKPDENMEPLSTLRKYRLPSEEERPVFGNTSPYFGVNLILNSEGTISVGDPVFVRYK